MVPRILIYLNIQYYIWMGGEIMIKRVTLKKMGTILFLLSMLTLLLIPSSIAIAQQNDEYEENVKLTLKAEISAYLPGETVHIFLFNQGSESIQLPNTAPWIIERNTSTGWTEVYTPEYANSAVILEPDSYRHWTWNQTYNNGSMVPEGKYRVVLNADKTYIREFLISIVYGKMGTGLLSYMLNESVSMDTVLSVIIIFNATLTNNCVTEELLEEMEQRIGPFNYSYLWNETKLPGLSTNLTKGQILTLAEWDVVSIIELNRMYTTVSPPSSSFELPLSHFTIIIAITICLAFVTYITIKKRKSG